MKLASGLHPCLRCPELKGNSLFTKGINFLFCLPRPLWSGLKNHEVRPYRPGNGKPGVAGSPAQGCDLPLPCHRPGVREFFDTMKMSTPPGDKFRSICTRHVQVLTDPASKDCILFSLLCSVVMSVRPVVSQSIESLRFSLFFKYEEGFVLGFLAGGERRLLLLF